MSVNLPPLGELHPVPGMRLAATSVGMYSPPRLDLAVIELAPDSQVAGVFTRSGFSAAPVQVCRQVLDADDPVGGLVINSGNANAATGERGLADARALCAQAQSVLGTTGAVLPFSTGVIGEFLPVERMLEGLAGCRDDLRSDGWLAAAQAIMTTDTQPKACSRKIDVDGAEVTLTAMAKGAGMMRPDMATLLAFAGCDARVAPGLMRRLVREVADASFNRLTVDGDTSTNDSFVLCATGQAQHDTIEEAGASYALLRDGLVEVCRTLAQWIVRDGEGATKFVTVRVTGAAYPGEAMRVAYGVAQSPLVKTAIFAGDPNWGRFCMAIGRAGVIGLDPDCVRLWLDDVQVAEGGMVCAGYSEDAAAAVMQRDEYTVRIDLNRGAAEEAIWTSDLSYEYVRVNAEYRS